MKPSDNSVIRFRELCIVDAEFLHAAAFGDVEVTRHLQWNTHASPDETKALVEEMIGLHGRGEKYFWVALGVDDDRIVGLASIKPGSDTAWIGFLVVSGEQRKGFGSMIVSALEAVVLGRFESVSAAVEPENHASVELLRKAGWIERSTPGVDQLLAYQKRVANQDGPAKQEPADLLRGKYYFARMTQFPPIAGGLDAYESYVEVMLYFLCSDCGASLDCPVADSDVAAPNPPWSTREGRRGRSLGWYVPPLTSDGSVGLTCFCPSCVRKRDLIVERTHEDVG